MERNSILPVSAATLVVFLVVSIRGGDPKLVTEISKNTFRVVGKRRRWHYFVSVAQVRVVVKALRERYDILFLFDAGLSISRDLLCAEILIVVGFLK